ncbi:MAG: two-component sensor histidine kinase [Micavibrio aeruginosavorus]|uniref:histidine kinase n=1 Tax=Micavibrio aeruginosavorus TaxID=349221 RepID=A0A2W5N3J2_9BACT|nr:MAG: two-component sensor histidine kinase [Micavibrio aeruginosavorus]
MALTPQISDETKVTSSKGGLTLWRALERATVGPDSWIGSISCSVFRKGWSGRLALILIAAIIASGAATYAALSETPPFGNDPDTVIWLLNLDLVIMILLMGLIARRFAKLLSGRKRGLAGSKLHIRLVVIFSVMAAAPAVIMAIFSTFFFHFGVQAWFSDRVKTAVESAQMVAESYLEEHQQVIKADILAMANDLDRQSALYYEDREKFDSFLETQSFMRNLSEVMIFDGRGKILARTNLTFTLTFEGLPDITLNQARDGEVVLMTGKYEDRVRALVKLNNYADAYLFVGRMVDPVVLSQLDKTKKAATAYETLSQKNSNLMVTITLIFIVVAIMFLLAATWFGIILARQLVTPIGSLITVSDRVRAGDLSARVEEGEQIDEFDYLAKSFNRMTMQIQEQRDEVMSANRQLEQRRRFTEAVLAGVTAGVVGVDAKGVITLVNASACDLFGTEQEKLIGRPIMDVVPDIGPLLEQAQQRQGKILQSEIPMLSKKDMTRRTLMVRISIDRVNDEIKGAVLTFDDITEIQAAQRNTAWSDIARRIAHEIKNPLTPIQLSAERLKRKYMKEIASDPETFAELSDTIIRHVGDIGRMVSEFSDFARLPEPSLKEENLPLHIRQTLVLQKEAHSDIDIKIVDKLGDMHIMCDAQQIRQALVNLIQNAVDSIHEKGGKGRINVLMTRDEADEHCIICVSDSGLGLPKNEDPSRLTEPYVTHKARGTGLGLAIVKKIMEDHGGRLVIGSPEWIKSLEGWDDLGGASVSFVLPLPEAKSNSRNKAA